MTYQEISSKYHYYSQKFRWIFILAAVILFLEVIILGFDNLQNKFTILGLKLDNQALTFLPRPQVEQIVKTEVDKTAQPLKFSYQDKIFEIKAEEIGAKVNITQFTNQLLGKGRTGGFFEKIIAQNKALLGQDNQQLTGIISQTLLNIKIVELQSEVNKEAQPISPDFADDLTRTIPAKDGIKINTNKLTVLMADHIFNPPIDPLPLPVVKTFTTHQEEELAPIRKQVAALITQPLAISSGGLVFTLTTADLKSMLKVAERPDPKDPKKLRLVLRLDEEKLNKKLGEFAQKVENITHAEFDDHDARVLIYSQFYSGKRYLANVPTGRALTRGKVLGEQTGGPKKVYLTFDDGPNSIYHPMVLDILKVHNIKATFFMVGQNTQRDQDTASRTALEGHKIGNHSNTHSFLPKLSASAILNELQQASHTLKPFNNNQEIELFRPPYGGVNLSVKQYADKLNMKLYLWDVDPRDWSEPETGELVNRVVSNAFNGADILFHSNHLSTVKALPKIIEALKSQGYSFETLAKN